MSATRWSVGWWLNLALRLVIATVFLWACMDKIAHPDRFADIVSDYKLLPAWTVNPFAVVLPWVEGAVAVCLVVGLWVPSAALLATGMTVMFMGAIVLGQGETCGCFSTSAEGRSDSWGLMFRDALLLAACGWLLWRTWPRGAWPCTNVSRETVQEGDGSEPGD